MSAWAEAIATRLAFYGQDIPPALARLAAAPGGLDAFLQACLDAVEREAGVAPLCALARAALAADRDDRAVNAAAAAVDGVAAMVPGRVVWLAAMAAHAPEYEAEAATMLVNDLAATGAALPRRAIGDAARRLGVTASGG
jgi:hypothetical protein